MSNQKSGSITVIVGHICSGKSTFTKKIASLFDVDIYIEESELNPHLVDFYSDPKRAGFIIQDYLLKKRAAIHVEAQLISEKKGRDVIIDGPIHKDFAFAEVNSQLGNIAPDDFIKHEKNRYSIMKSIKPPDNVVYLSVPTSVCKERIIQRCEQSTILDCEKKIELNLPNYFELLDERYSKVVLPMFKKMGIEPILLNWENFDGGFDYIKFGKSIGLKLKKINL